jgi:hypothetical protein
LFKSSTDWQELDDSLRLSASMQASAPPSITVSSTSKSSERASTTVTNSPTTSIQDSVHPNAANAPALLSYGVTINGTLKKTKSATEGSLALAQINYRSSQSLRVGHISHHQSAYGPSKTKLNK